MTNRERYRVLHSVADELLSLLQSVYEVDRAEGLDVDTKLARGAPVERCVRLIPSVADGAPLTIAFSSFPGLFVRYGLYVRDWLPRCGCDACDEDPEALVSELRTRAELLARGRFTEEILPGAVLAFVFDGHVAGRSSPITSDDIAGPLTPVTQDWAPWSGRVVTG